jgi:molecular chaperone GrpE
MDAEGLYEPTDLDACEMKVAELTHERDVIRDQLVRALADLQNSRRRAQQEREDMRRFATESLVRDILPVLDNFERTLAAAEGGATVEALLDGVRLVERQLRQVLDGVAVRRIVAAGEPFDPALHEAIGSEPRDDVEAGTIVAEVEAGYIMNNRVIRPARVRVAAKP